MELEELGTMYEVAYAWINNGDGTRCAWCKRLESEIDDPNRHITRHVVEDIIVSAMTDYMGDSECTLDEATDKMMQLIDNVHK